jgi:nucleotide-binding universal stress UspA family protein
MPNPVANAAPFRKVLVATDFSDHAAAAFRQAIWFARHSSATVTLAHVIGDMSITVSRLSYEMLGAFEIEQIERESRQKADQHLADLKDATAAEGIEVTFQTLVGQPFVAITNAVQSGSYDLVFCGSRGHTRLHEFLMGGTARRLIRKCPSAVWVTHGAVGPGATAVVATVDFSDLSRQALSAASWIAQAASAVLHVVHVLEPSTLDAPLLEAVVRHSGDNWQSVMRDAAERRLQAFVNEVVGSDRPRLLHVEFGEPWEFIRDTVRRVRGDLVVMGTVGRSGVQGVLLGNTAEKLLGVMDCAVLTVKPPGFVSPIPPASG